MHHAEQGYLASTNELMSLHVSRTSRRAASMASAIQTRLSELLDVHGALPAPPQAGRRIGLSAGAAR